MDTLGKRVSETRRRKGLSLRALAQEVGVSAGFLSQIENDQVVPSLTSLRGMATALSVPVSYLVDDYPAGNPVVRVNERIKLAYPGSEVNRELLTPGFGHALQAFAVTLRQGEASMEGPVSHPSEELVIVLEGELTVELGSEEYHLTEGDAMLYNARIPHNNRSSSPNGAYYFVINTPPT